MEMTEKTHAYIAARYYVRLKENFAERGVEAFRMAVRYYGEQRGRRMAQRAVADGKPLNYATYQEYGEWMNTESVIAGGQENRAEVVSLAPDYEIHVMQCPWHAEFHELGMPEAGLAYCLDLDPSICRGFNPAIDYRTLQTLHDHDFCIQTVAQSGLSKDTPVAARRRDGIKSFRYHCAHSYWSFREIVTGIFGEAGAELSRGVLSDIRETWGDEAANVIEAYEGTDFNVNTEETPFPG